MKNGQEKILNVSHFKLTTKKLTSFMVISGDHFGFLLTTLVFYLTKKLLFSELDNKLLRRTCQNKALKATFLFTFPLTKC